MRSIKKENDVQKAQNEKRPAGHDALRKNKITLQMQTIKQMVGYLFLIHIYLF